MAAPDYVPTDPTNKVRRYSSPPSRKRSWVADRPGDLAAGQPEGTRFGTQGPDQGYAYKLVNHFDGMLHLGQLAKDDVVSGCVAIAMKRSGLFGRGPIIHDLTAAFSVYGFLNQDAEPELVEMRESLFSQIANAHHYNERRAVVDNVLDSALRQPHGVIESSARRDWRSNLAS